jgi:hypothetical protein
VKTTTNDPRVDDLRERLRSLGYLDAGVDRFVLGPATGARRPASLAFLSSLRVGILAAILLGPAAAIGLTARMPNLVTGPRDAVIVALYLGMFFGLAVALAAFVSGLIVARVSRTRIAQRKNVARFIARAGGIAVTLLCLAYLTLWWHTVIAELGWSAPVWTLSALAIAVATSLLLGHAVMVMSSAIVVASSGGGAAARPESWKSVVLTAAVAFGGAVLLLTWWPSGAGSPPTRPPLTVVPTGAQARVIAIDGFDGRVFEEIRRTRPLPVLSAVLEGATAQLDTRDPSAAGPIDPARVWTTVATGQPPSVHGVHGLETRRVAGLLGSVPAREQSPLGRAIRGATDLVRLTQPAIASGVERRAKTFWEVAAEAGLRTTVVNWWATWPAPHDAGTVLTDRAVLRLEHGGTLDAEVSPPHVYDALRTRWPELKGQATALASAALAASLNGPVDLTIGDEAAAVLHRSAELDAMQLVLQATVTSTATDLSVVYLPGLDIAQHKLLGEATGHEPARVSALSARLEGIKLYYVMLDRLLGSTRSAVANEVLFVITEPGRVNADAGARLSIHGVGVGGGPVQRNGVDVAPTILFALGVPLARDLKGTPMLELFNRDLALRYPVRYVETYGPPEAATSGKRGQPLDQEMIDRLRSLGYVR